MSRDVADVVGRRLVDVLEGHLRAAVAMGADDVSAARMVLRRIEILFRAPLTRSYRADALDTYTTRARQLREGGTVPTQRRGLA